MLLQRYVQIACKCLVSESYTLILLGRLPIRVLTIDFIFFSLLPISANFSRHRGQWRHLSIFVLSSKYSDHCQNLPWNLDTHSHTTEIMIIFLDWLIKSMGPVLNFLYITKELKGHPLYYNFGLYEMVVFNIVYTFVLERPFALKRFSLMTS